MSGGAIEALVGAAGALVGGAAAEWFNRRKRAVASDFAAGMEANHQCKNECHKILWACDAVRVVLLAAVDIDGSMCSRVVTEKTSVAELAFESWRVSAVSPWYRDLVRRVDGGGVVLQRADVGDARLLDHYDRDGVQSSIVFEVRRGRGGRVLYLSVNRGTDAPLDAGQRVAIATGIERIRGHLRAGWDALFLSVEGAAKV